MHSGAVALVKTSQLFTLLLQVNGNQLIQSFSGTQVIKLHHGHHCRDKNTNNRLMIGGTI